MNEENVYLSISFNKIHRSEVEGIIRQLMIMGLDRNGMNIHMAEPIPDED